MEKVSATREAETPKFLQPIKPIVTVGHLDEVAIADGSLIISGWAASSKAGAIESFKVVIGDRELSAFEQNLGLPSPDVKKNRPNLDNAEAARFQLRVPLNPTQIEQSRDSLLALTPLFPDGEGEVLLKIFNPSLPIPSKELINKVGGAANNFVPRSLKFLGYFIQRLGLQPTAAVLEVGCGAANMAYALSYYLQPPGRYQGFDAIEELISWGKQEITSRKSHFNFRHEDVFHPIYNPTGKLSPTELTFADTNESFDFVFVGYWFLHLQEAEVRRCLAEISRVLKFGGRCLVSCFLLNPQSQQLISRGKSSEGLSHQVGNAFVKDLSLPQKAIGFRQSLFWQWLNDCGLEVVEKYDGSWCGYAGSLAYEDMLVLSKVISRPTVQVPEVAQGKNTEKSEVGNEGLEGKSEIELAESSPSISISTSLPVVADAEPQKSESPEIEATGESPGKKRSPLLAKIEADLERSRAEMQKIKTDLESSQLDRASKTVNRENREKKNLNDTPPVEQASRLLEKTEPVETSTSPVLLGLSGVTLEKFWELVNPVIEKRRAKSSRHPKPNTQPSISILTPTWNSSLDWFVETVLSVLNQTMPNWEWCLVDDGSKTGEIKSVLAALAEKEPRIKIRFAESGGISAATNKALEMATGDYICCLDHDDTLAPTALEDSLNKLAQNFDVVYSDEDKIDLSGLNYIQPFYKPDWSPEYFRGVMYVGHLLCVRRELALQVGGFKSEFDGVQDYEFMLRVSEITNKIAHIPKHLYHWRQIRGSISADADAKAGIEVVQQAAVNSHLQRLGLLAKAEPGSGRHRVNINPQNSPLSQGSQGGFSSQQSDNPLISLIVCSQNPEDRLKEWLESLLSKTVHTNGEVIVVLTYEKTEELPEVIHNFPVKTIRVEGQSNFSIANNFAAKEAQGEYLVFINPGLRAVTEDWLRHLLYYGQQSDVSAVSGLLISADGTVEHAGMVLGCQASSPDGKNAAETEIEKTIDFVMRGFAADSDGYAGSLVCAREVSAVSRDCLMVKKNNFVEVGGFGEYFFSGYQDADLCMRFRRDGKRVIFTPRAVLVNPHSTNLELDKFDVIDRKLFLDCWQLDIERGDPYYNCNFDKSRNDYSEKVES